MAIQWSGRPSERHLNHGALKRVVAQSSYTSVPVPISDRMAIPSSDGHRYRAPSQLALGLAVAGRILSVLRDGFGWRLCLLGFVCEPWIYFRDWHSLAELRKGLSRPRSEHGGDEPSTFYHSRTGSHIHGLAHQERDSWTLESAIMQGHSNGRHWIGQRIDEYLQSASELCALRWAVVARRWLESVSPQNVLAVPSA